MVDRGISPQVIYTYTYCLLYRTNQPNNNSAQHLLLVPAQKALCTKLIRVVHLEAHNTFVLCIDLLIEALCTQRFAHNSAHNVFTYAHNCAQGLRCTQHSAAFCAQSVRTTDARLRTKNFCFGNKQYVWCLDTTFLVFRPFSGRELGL